MDIEQVCEELRGVAGRLGAIEVGESIEPADVRRGMTELSGVRAAVMRLQLAFTSRAAVQAETGDAPPVLDVLTGAGKVSTREATESVRHVELLRLLPRVAAGVAELHDGTPIDHTPPPRPRRPMATPTRTPRPHPHSVHP